VPALLADGRVFIAGGGLDVNGGELTTGDRHFENDRAYRPAEALPNRRPRCIVM